MTTETVTDRATDTVAGLRAIADLIEANPILVGNDLLNGCWVTVMSFTYDAALFGERVAALGPCVKGSDATELTARREFADRVSLVVQVPKSLTCEQVQTGTEVVTREVHPDGIEPELVTEEVPVYEWQCPPSFLGLAASTPEMNAS